jgi:hypothetical protein
VPAPARGPVRDPAWGEAGLRTGWLAGRAARLVDRAARLAGTANACRNPTQLAGAQRGQYRVSGASARSAAGIG